MESELTVPISGLTATALLEDWRWLVAEPCELVMLTRMGDAFVEAADGSILFIDTLEGAAKLAASSREAFFSLMNSGAYDRTWFNPDMVALKRSQGETLGTRECYTYKVPPILGAPLDSSNVGRMDIVVHFSLSGQLHRQLASMPPGTRISEFRVVDRPQPQGTPSSPGLFQRLFKRRSPKRS